MIAAARQAKAVRIRLAAVNLLVSALVLAITLGTAALTAVRSQRSSVDADLREVADHVVAQIGHERDERRSPRGEHEHDDDDDDDDHERRGRRSARAEVTAPTPATTDPLTSIELEDEPGTIVLFATGSGVIRRAGGDTIPKGLPDPVGIESALGGRELFSDVALKGAPARVLTVPVRAGSSVIGAVQVVRPTAESREALTRTLGILAATGAGGLLLSLVGSFILAGRAMRPIELSLDRQRRFIADASHELRTPVAVVRARAELLANDARVADAALRGELGQLSREAEELSNLLTDLLDLARLDADPTPLEVGPVPLLDVAEEVAEQLAPLATARGVVLETRGEVVFALASLARLRQVLRALADNAVKHTAAGGKVEILCDERGGMARVRVHDNGEGIAAEHLPHVKDRFYRADAARTRSGGNAGGAGLGLAIAHELVEKMSGALTIESELARGTTVTVLIPLANVR
ncbi:MAG: hypothetical protein JNK04_20525 [Myxococcales bacterium]|nr:hypothetical protein [Myxococcales bacterium]